MDAPVDYIPDFVPDPDELFRVLMEEVPWSVRTHLGGGLLGNSPVPRDEAYYNDWPAPYTYGPGRTHYPQPAWHPAILELREQLEDFCCYELDVCFLNRYRNNRDHLGWHADDSPEMDPARPVVTVSLGAERDIKFRTKKDARDAILRVGSPKTEALTLGHGSAAFMRPGMQQKWLHQIPKDSRNHIGPRISLTFRGYAAPADKTCATCGESFPGWQELCRKSHS